MPRIARAALAATLLVSLAPSPSSADKNGGGGGSPDGEISAYVIGLQYGTPPRPGSPDSNGCTWFKFDPDRFPNQTPTKQQDGVTLHLVGRFCAGGTLTVHWVQAASPAVLSWAGRDYLADRLPAPVVRLQPPAARQVVNIGTWFWTTPDTWRTISVTAWLPTPGGGIAWATTTATPTVTTFQPGDGNPPVTCRGAGRPQVEANRWQRTPRGACRYVAYGRAADGLDAALSVQWEVTWTGTFGNGTLDPITMTTPTVVSIDELQAVIVN